MCGSETKVRYSKQVSYNAIYILIKIQQKKTKTDFNCEDTVFKAKVVHLLQQLKQIPLPVSWI